MTYIITWNIFQSGYKYFWKDLYININFWKLCKQEEKFSKRPQRKNRNHFKFCTHLEIDCWFDTFQFVMFSEGNSALHDNVSCDPNLRCWLSGVLLLCLQLRLHRRPMPRIRRDWGGSAQRDPGQWRQPLAPPRHWQGAQKVVPWAGVRPRCPALPGHQKQFGPKKHFRQPKSGISRRHFRAHL